MLQLAIESSTRTVSVCILNGDSPITSRTLDGKHAASSGLVPEIADALQAAGFQPKEIGLVSVSIGPGSFTGLRIGVMLAKTLAYALPGIVLVGVSTHEVIAHQGLSSLTSDEKAFSSKIASIINAQRGQWFVQIFDCQQDPLRPIESNRILDPTHFSESNDSPCWMCGPGLTAGNTDPLVATGHYRICTPESWGPSASVVGHIGWARFQRGETTDHWRLDPVYGRVSAAEEKLLLKKRDEV